MSLQTLHICLLLTSLLNLERANAQHSDVLLQNVEDRLTSGDADFISGARALGARSFTQVFNSTFAVTDPGWNALGTGAPNLPADAQPLPANSNIAWDFLPMKINNRLSNLFYWNETREVQFGDTPSASYEFAMQSKSSGFISIDGSSNLVTGATIDNTDSIGALHRHRFFFLDDGDDNLSTDPARGIYLAALHIKTQTLDRSRPLFFLFGTPDSSTAALAEAQQWVDAHLDELAPDFAADFDGDLAVDATDLAVWQTGFSTSGSEALQTAGDANFDPNIDGADFLVWQRQYGSDPISFHGGTTTFAANTTQVPEPTTVGLTLVGAFCFCGRSRSKLRLYNGPARPSQQPGAVINCRVVV